GRGGFGPGGGCFGPGGGGGPGGGRGGTVAGMNSMSAGMSAASPVSDGKHIAMVAGNGVVVVYDREGKRLWGKFIEPSRIGFGPSSTPLLVRNKLIVHFNDL